MRLSDIFKKIENLQEQKVEQQPKIQEIKKEEVLQEPKGVQQEAEKKSILSAEEIYSYCISSIKSLFKDLNLDKTNISASQILDSTKKIVDGVFKNPDELILYASYTTVDNYIYSHSVNTAIYTAFVTLNLNFSPSDLEEITLCALLHDIGMAKILNVVSKSEKITQEECEEVKKHPEYTKIELSKIDLPRSLKDLLEKVILQTHERIDGSGYPNGVVGEKIDFYSKIIAIADVYEAMTHPRPWKERIIPHEAIISIVKQADKFEHSIAKVFVDRFSLFPPGSYVKLNTGEIARVVGVNCGSPLRPKVKMILTSEGKPAQENQIINLLENTKIHILEPIDETKIDVKDKKLLLQIRAQRWWVKEV
jgi:HD-GYP domain-containing protein (c-di-GMP phosphodiesterase class II)